MLAEDVRKIPEGIDEKVLFRILNYLHRNPKTYYTASQLSRRLVSNGKKIRSTSEMEEDLNIMFQNCLVLRDKKPRGSVGQGAVKYANVDAY